MSQTNQVDQERSTTGSYRTVSIPTTINHELADYSKGQDAMTVWVESLKQTVNRLTIDQFQTSLASIIFDDELYQPKFTSKEDIIARPGLQTTRG